MIAPVTQVQGTWLKDLPGAQGNASVFNITTNPFGLGIADNRRAPAEWRFKWIFSPTALCDGQTVDAVAHFIDDDVGLLCSVITVGGVPQSASVNAMADYVFSPSPVATDGSSGTEAVIVGPGFSTQFGMPLLQYFDLNGNLVAQTSADAVAADGSWMSSPIPDISQLPVGTYVGFLNNANASGDYDVLGVTSVRVVPPLLPPPQDPCPGNICINQS